MTSRCNLYRNVLAELLPTVEHVRSRQTYKVWISCSPFFWKVKEKKGVAMGLIVASAFLFEKNFTKKLDQSPLHPLIKHPETDMSIRRQALCQRASQSDVNADFRFAELICGPPTFDLSQLYQCLEWLYFKLFFISKTVW